MRRQIALTLGTLLVIVSPASAGEFVSDGVITSVSEEIGKLLRLRWADERLVLDRDYWEHSVGIKTEDEKAKDEIQGMVNRGIPEEIARKIAAQPGRRGRDFLTSTPEGKLFTDIKAAAGAMSGGGGGGSDERQWNGRGDGILLTMNVHYGLKDFRFMIREGKAPFQELLLEEHHKKGLRIQFSSPERHVVFSQSPNGVIRAAQVSDERTEAFQCDSYEEMVVQRSAFAEELGLLLTRLGINKPLTMHDPRVVKTVGRLLLKPDEVSINRATAAISRLSAQVYAIREEAQAALVENRVAWRNVIREKLQEPMLDPETKARLQAILGPSDFDAEGVERFIDQRNLLGDVTYLSSIIAEVPDSLRSGVQRRIDEISLK